MCVFHLIHKMTYCNSSVHAHQARVHHSHGHMRGSKAYSSSAEVPSAERIQETGLNQPLSATFSMSSHQKQPSWMPVHAHQARVHHPHGHMRGSKAYSSSAEVSAERIQETGLNQPLSATFSMSSHQKQPSWMPQCTLIKQECIIHMVTCEAQRPIHHRQKYHQLKGYKKRV